MNLSRYASLFKDSCCVGFAHYKMWTKLFTSHIKMTIWSTGQAIKAYVWLTQVKDWMLNLNIGTALNTILCPPICLSISWIELLWLGCISNLGTHHTKIKTWLLPVGFLLQVQFNYQGSHIFNKCGLIKKIVIPCHLCHQMAC